MAMSAILRKAFGHWKSMGAPCLEVRSWELGASVCCANGWYAVLRKASLEGKETERSCADDQGAAYINVSFGRLGTSVLVARRLHAGKRCEVIGLP